MYCFTKSQFQPARCNFFTSAVLGRAVSENDLPLQLPEIDKFLPTETGKPLLGRAKEWEYEI
jgi:hypothetical protein